MSSIITLRRVLPEFYEYGTGTLIWRVLYVLVIFSYTKHTHTTHHTPHTAMHTHTQVLASLVRKQCKLHTFLAGSLSQPQFTTPTCVITTSFVNIMAQCASDTMATGFQMIAQLSDEVHKLYINQSMDLQTPVTVEVEESGVYLITIIPITKEAGIVGSGVEYVGEVMVETTPTSYLTTVENTSSGTECVFACTFFAS